MHRSEKTCPKCGSILKDGVCLNCGYVENPVKIEETQTPLGQPDDLFNAPDNTEVKSIFADIVKKSDEDYSVETAENSSPTGTKALILPSILAVILLLIAGASYYLFVYASTEFVSPLVLSTEDIRNQEERNYTEDNIDEIPITNLTGTERTLELTSNLTEGNLEKYNFAQFATPGTKLFFEAFDIIKILETFDGSDLLVDVKEAFDFDNDDVLNYLSDGFAMMYPEGDLNVWGFVIGVNDEEFVSERVEQFLAEKEADKDGYEYANYYVKLVEIEMDEEASKFFLLVSNSNEYLDQMIESSEGNLSNLADELQYVQSRVDLPKIGEFYAYKSSDSSVWDIFADYVSSKYEYEGLNRILQNVTSRGLVIYTNVNKLKIVGSEN